MHPNQKNIHKSTMERYKELGKEVSVLLPESYTDSYALIKKSELIINFCSSIALEANYMRKPVVQIGPSSFMRFMIANIVESIDEAIDLIYNKKYKVMPKRGSIISFTYYMKPSFKLPAYDFLEDGVYAYGGISCRAPLHLRLVLCQQDYVGLRVIRILSNLDVFHKSNFRSNKSKIKIMKIYVDIDNTICKTKERYSKAKPIYENVIKINKLYNDGHEIIYWTARSSVTKINHYDLTLNQLKTWKCCFIIYLLVKSHTMTY